MGYIRHHAIVVTATYGYHIQEAHTRACDIFDAVSGITPTGVNFTDSFFIPPDGSKEGWSESDAGNERRKRFIEWLDTQRYEDGSGPFSWVEVQYGDDDLVTQVCSHSDEPERRHAGALT